MGRFSVISRTFGCALQSNFLGNIANDFIVIETVFFHVVATHGLANDFHEAFVHIGIDVAIIRVFLLPFWDLFDIFVRYLFNRPIQHFPVLIRFFPGVLVFNIECFSLCITAVNRPLTYIQLLESVDEYFGNASGIAELSHVFEVGQLQLY